MNTILLDYPVPKQFIAGAEVEGAAKRFSVIDPATESVLASFPGADAATLDRALTAAAQGFHVWRAVSAYERGQVLRRVAALLRERREKMAQIMALESGKPLAEAAGEIGASAEVFEWFAEEGRRAYGRVIPSRAANARMTVLREPVGPVAAFTPWNFPALTPARKIAAALAAGCSIIIKPSEETPATCLELATCCYEAGLPAEALSVVIGEAANIAAHLIRSRVIRKVSFTGSVQGGQAVASLAAEGIKRLTLELGGHAPVLVFADTENLEKVAELAVKRKFRNAGQVCVAPSRFYVERAVYDAFVAHFVTAAEALQVGSGFDALTQMGPLANQRRLEACEKLVAEAIASGAELLAGGARLSRPGFFYAPTVLGHVPEHARIMAEEPFGPVVPVVAFDTEEEAVRLANAVPVGLAGHVFTTSHARSLRLAEVVECGMLGINRFEINAPETPFGGVKESGYGSEGGSEGLDAYLSTKLVSEA